MKNRYEVRGDVVTIFIKCGEVEKECLISPQDLTLVDSYKGTWYGEKSKNTDGGYYAKITIGHGYGTGTRHREFMHKAIMSPDKEMVVDHRNHNTLDNTRDNLRNATRSQNSQNRKGSYSNTGVRGVSLISKGKYKGKYVPRLSVIGKVKYLGRFDTLEEAIQAVKMGRETYLPFSEN